MLLKPFVMENACPRTPKCPLFNDGLLRKKESVETYKRMYCLSEDKYETCKRYIVADKVGKCPDFVMPNSFYTVEEIIDRMQKEGLLQYN